MVRYWCGECSEEHDNARDCPHYSRVGKSYERGQKVGNDMKRRRQLPNNDYSDPANAPKGLLDDCLSVFILLIAFPSVSVLWLAWEITKWI